MRTSLTWCVAAVTALALLSLFCCLLGGCRQVSSVPPPTPPATVATAPPSEAQAPSHPSPGTALVAVKAGTKGLEVLLSKAFDAKELEGEGYRTDAFGPPQRFQPGDASSRFVAVRVKVSVGTEPVELPKLILTGDGKEYKPLASNFYAGTKEFLFGVGEKEWQSAQQWTTIVLPWNEWTVTDQNRPSTIMIGGDKQDRSLTLNLIYEVPTATQSFALERRQ